MAHAQTTNGTSTEWQNAVGQTLQQAAEIAARLEHGRAVTPLTSHFHRLARHPEDRKRTAVLAGVDPDSLVPVLEWVTGVMGEAVLQALLQSPGFLRIVFGSRDFGIRVGTARMAASDRDEFLKTLRGLQQQNTESASIVLELPGDDCRSGLDLFVVKSPWELQQQPELLNDLSAIADVLILSGTAEQQTREAATSSLANVAGCFTFVGCVVCDGGKTAGDASTGATDTAGDSDIVRLNGASDPQWPAWLDPHSELTGQIQAARQSVPITTSLEMLHDSVDQQLRYHSRRKQILAAVVPENAEAQLKSAADKLHTLTDDSLDQIDRRLNEHFRQRTVPSAETLNRITNFMEDLTPGDISEEPAYKVTRLKVSDDFLQQGLAIVRNSVHDSIDADLIMLNDESARLQNEFCQQFEALTGTSRAIDLPPVDRDEAVARIDELIHVDTRYHGELPRRNWMDRISYGRRPVFMIMMMGSLIGSALGIRGGLMAWLLPAMLVIFLLGTIWTFRSFRDERQSRIERELRRLRDTLGTEFKRLHTNVLKDWLGQTGEHLKQTRREALRQTDDQLRSIQQELQSTAQREQVEAQERQRSIDQQLRNLDTLLQQTGQLHERWRQVVSSLNTNGISCTGQLPIV